MDPFNNISSIPGSRHPILVPAFTDNSSTSSDTPTPPSALTSTTSSVSSSRSRRKPAYVFKSPSADEPGQWEAHTSTRKRATPSYTRVAPRRASTDTDTTRSSSNHSSASISVAVPRNAPLLPLYHPLGTLAQSLPKLDPGLFGLPGSLNIDELDEQGDIESGSSSSRVRRGGVPKARETGDDESQSTGTPNGTGKAAQDASPRERNPSPRKRRGGGGGGKRKRKDVDDGDAIFPPPAKRTRNPRGVAANNSAPAAPSPLVGPAVVASDLVEGTPENNGEGEAEAQEEVQAPKRSSRTRKPRRPAKRRDSSGSASTGTSVSVSIAVTAKVAAQTKADAAHGEAQDDARPPAEANDKGEKREEKDTEDASAVRVRSNKPMQRDDAAPAPPEVPQTTTGAGGPGHKNEGPRDEPPDVPMRTVTPPPVIPPAPVPPPVPEKEEREEGELSDDGPDDNAH